MFEGVSPADPRGKVCHTCWGPGVTEGEFEALPMGDGDGDGEGLPLAVVLAVPDGVVDVDWEAPLEGETEGDAWGEGVPAGEGDTELDAPNEGEGDPEAMQDGEAAGLSDTDRVPVTLGETDGDCEGS